MSFLIDSNVLISSYDEIENQHKLSYAFVEKAVNGEVDAALAHQNLLEYLAVITDRKRVEHPLSLEEALVNIDIYLASLHIISPKPTTFVLLKRLLTAKPVTAGWRQVLGKVGILTSDELECMINLKIEER